MAAKRNLASIQANEKNLSDTPGGVEVSDSGKEFDQRSHDRRHRKPIAANPANSGFAANDPDHKQPSKSAAAGAIAAVGAGAAGVAAAALSPSAKTTAGDSSTSSNRDKSNTANTYDSENAVSGFAASDNPTSFGTSDKTGHTKPHEGDAESDGDSQRLWTPDSATGQRDADGTLRYPHRNAEAANTASNTTATVKKSDGWFHWLWWPVLFFGSILGVCLMFLNPDGSFSYPTNQDVDPSVATASDGESDSGDAAVVADGEESEDAEIASEESNSDILSSSIQITPNESDATTSDATTKADDPSEELTMDLTSADPSNEGESDSASQAQDSGKTAAEANASSESQDAMPSLEGSLETDGAKNEDENAGDNDNSENAGTDSSELNTSDLELDADEQVEELLSAIETELDGVNNESQAEAAKESLSQHISTLEKVLADRAQWKDEIEVLVDFQLEEGKKMLTKAQEKASQLDAVKKTLNGKFKELNALMKTRN